MKFWLYALTIFKVYFALSKPLMEEKNFLPSNIYGPRS